MKKIKLIFRSSRLTASCRMVFFKVPYSRTISQIRVLSEDYNYYVVDIHYKNGKVISSKWRYSTLSYAVEETLKYIKKHEKH